MRVSLGHTADAVSGKVAAGVVIALVGTAIGSPLLLGGAGASLVELVLPLGTALLAAMWVWRSPGAYLGIFWACWFLTPLVRRLVDWRLGFDPANLIILTPFLVGLVSLVDLFRKGRRPIPLPFLLLAVAVAYGLLIGVMRNGLVATLFDTVQWAVPPVVGLYVWNRRREHYESMWRWTAVVFFIGLSVSGIYGVIQFIRITPWDAAWMNAVPMGSIGWPEPYRVRVFSTLNSPGPFARMMVVGLILMIVVRGRYLGRLRWIAGVSGAFGLLLSLVRAAWGGLGVGVFVLILLGARKDRPKLLFVTAVLTVGCVAGLMFIADEQMQDRIVTRTATLSDLGADGSLNARMGTYSEVGGLLLVNAVGRGFGASGTATLAQDASSSTFSVLDSGFLTAGITFGIAGGTLYLAGLVLLARMALKEKRLTNDPRAAAVLAAATAIFAQMMFASTLVGVTGTTFWVLLSLLPPTRTETYG